MPPPPRITVRAFIERRVGEAEARAEIIIVARRPGGLQIVVVAQAIAQAQIRSRLKTVLQVAPENVSANPCVRVAETLVSARGKPKLICWTVVNGLSVITGTRSGRPSRAVESAVASWSAAACDDQHRAERYG